MSTPTLNIDPALIEGAGIPVGFINAHYSPEELMERLNITDESDFWLAVREGVIPRGVYLPVNPPLCCWSIAVIDEWLKAGCPRDGVHEMHKQMVFQNLIDTVRSTLSANPPTMEERN